MLVDIFLAMPLAGLCMMVPAALIQLCFYPKPSDSTEFNLHGGHKLETISCVQFVGLWSWLVWLMHALLIELGQLLL